MKASSKRQPWFAALRRRRVEMVYLNIGLTIGFIGGALCIGGLWWLL